MSSSNPRVAALVNLVAQYEKSLANFTAINEELRTLPPSQRLAEIIELNEVTLASTARLLDSARTRLAREHAVANRSPDYQFSEAADTEPLST